MSVTIFTMTHKKFPTPGDLIYVPLQVGRAGAEDLGYIGDDAGVSISEKNCYYGELTGVYWVWKNIKTSVTTAGISARRRGGFLQGRNMKKSSRNTISSLLSC